METSVVTFEQLHHCHSNTKMMRLGAACWGMGLLGIVDGHLHSEKAKDLV